MSMSGLPIDEHCVGFEVFTAVTVKNAILWDVAHSFKASLLKTFYKFQLLME
jgi:hypothetical protein